MGAPTKRGIVHTPQAFILHTLSYERFDNVSSIGAGVANTTVQTHIALPTVYKISKVAVSLTAIDAIAGLDSFNLVVGGLQGQTAQSYNQNNAAPNDNSYSHAAGAVVGSDSLGYPTNIATAGMTVFPTDVPFNPADATYGTAQYAANGSGWISLATSGGYGIFVPPNYDAVYPAGTPLSLRVTTVAATGSISNLRVVLCIEPQGLRAGPVPSSTYYQPAPGIDF